MGSRIRVLLVGVGVVLVASCTARWRETNPPAPPASTPPADVVAQPSPVPTPTPTPFAPPSWPSPSPVPTPSPAPPSSTPTPAPSAIERSIHVALGVPRDGDDSDDVLLDKMEYVVSYNPHLNVPNWVAWHLDASDLGSTKRSGKFSSETALPPPFYVVQDSDYSGSGYDRGHLCPSADRTSSLDANRATFVFTNILPQIHELNSGPWEKLESHARELANRGKELFIVAGGTFASDPKRIGKNADPARRVAVPNANFKIVVVLDRHGQGAESVSASTQAIAVLMPNDRSTRGRAFTDYLTTVRDIERATGYDFHARVPPAIQDVFESRR